MSEYLARKYFNYIFFPSDCNINLARVERKISIFLSFLNDMLCIVSSGLMIIKTETRAKFRTQINNELEHFVFIR